MEDKIQREPSDGGSLKGTMNFNHIKLQKQIDEYAAKVDKLAR